MAWTQTSDDNVFAAAKFDSPNPVIMGLPGSRKSQNILCHELEPDFLIRHPINFDLSTVYDKILLFVNQML